MHASRRYLRQHRAKAQLVVLRHKLTVIPIHHQHKNARIRAAPFSASRILSSADQRQGHGTAGSNLSEVRTNRVSVALSAEFSSIRSTFLDSIAVPGRIKHLSTFIPTQSISALVQCFCLRNETIMMLSHLVKVAQHQDSGTVVRRY